LWRQTGDRQTNNKSVNISNDMSINMATITNPFVLFLLALIVWFAFFSDKMETFANGDAVNLVSADGRYVAIIPNTAVLSLTDQPAQKATFTYLQHDDPSSMSIKLSIDPLTQNSSHVGKYVTCCFTPRCKDALSLINLNPFASNSKLKSVVGNDEYSVFYLYDGSFAAIDESTKTIYKGNSPSDKPVRLKLITAA